MASLLLFCFLVLNYSQCPPPDSLVMEAGLRVENT